MKKIYYLLGLPRAGNTLVGSVLNQNPKISVTANSIVPEILWQIEKLKEDRTFLNFPDHLSLNNVLKNIVSNYYSDWDSDVIIDRSAWGRINNLDLLEKYVSNDLKFILLVRSMEEVIASFIHWSENNKPNFIDDDTNNGSFKEKAEYLLNDSRVRRDYNSIVTALKSGHPCYLIEYKNLVSSPDDIISGLYKFLDIELYQHDFDHIDPFSVNGLSYDDSVVGSDLHTIRTDGIRLNKYDITKYLSKDLIDYCSTLNFWN
tara:strand:- start:3841 stop:4620 length:780 start_codon:yes stop_codon:yes gene_type:complete